MVWGCPGICGEVNLASIFLASTLDYFYVGQKSLTHNILATQFRVWAKTCLTSHATVNSDGMYWWGLPVFINAWKPRSLTIENGRRLSNTHRTIFALQDEIRFTCSMDIGNCMGIPWGTRGQTHIHTHQKPIPMVGIPTCTHIYQCVQAHFLICCCQKKKITIHIYWLED